MTVAADTCDGLGDRGMTEPVIDLPPDVPALRRLYLYLSAGCNLHCRHCWITPTFVHGKPVQGECINFELLKAAVAEAKPMGLVSAKLTGGEPVLHPDFLRIADFLTEENLDISMETNATLIDQAMANHLREKTKLCNIAVSLDSPIAEQHDRFRGVRGAFDAAVRGFGHLVSAGFRPQIIMSVDRENVHQIEGLIELAIGLGAGSVKFNPVTPSGRGAEIHRLGQGLEFGELLELTHRIRGPLQDRYPIHLSAMVPPALLRVKELLRSGGDGGCCNVLNILGILGTGEMALCGIGRNIPELCFGMLGKDSLREVWTAHPALRRMRQDLAGPFPDLCGDCIHAGRCLTHCLAMNYETSGKLVNVSQLCAEAERRGQFPPTRRVSWGRGQPGA
jgi:SynChlorMet cassette radical SAM/SPASM protein ScmF